MPASDHPCLRCGACCASFRVDFSAHETQALGGSVPDGLAVEVTRSICRMRARSQAGLPASNSRQGEGRHS